MPAWSVIRCRISGRLWISICNEYKVLWIKLHSWRQLEKGAAVGALIFGGLGAASAYALKAPLESTGQYAAAGIAGGAVLLSALRMITDEAYQLDAAKNYMIEFLENTYAHKYEKRTLRQEADLRQEEEERVVEAAEEEQKAVVLQAEEDVSGEELLEFAPDETKESEVQEDEGSGIGTGCTDEGRAGEGGKKRKKRKEKRRQDEEMIRQILAEFLT